MLTAFDLEYPWCFFIEVDPQLGNAKGRHQEFSGCRAVKSGEDVSTSYRAKPLLKALT